MLFLLCNLIALLILHDDIIYMQINVLSPLSN